MVQKGLRRFYTDGKGGEKGGYGMNCRVEQVEVER